MPDWLIQVLVQYPIVVLMGLVAWYVYRKIERTNAEARDHERENHAATVELIKKNYERLLEAQAGEVTRLGKELKDEVRKLAKTVAELNERLGS
jgi:hypothetical protein